MERENTRQEESTTRSQEQSTNNESQQRPIMKMGGTNFYEGHVIRTMPLPSWNNRR